VPVVEKPTYLPNLWNFQNEVDKGVEIGSQDFRGLINVLPFSAIYTRFFTPPFLLSNPGFPSLFNSFIGDCKYVKNHLKLTILFGYIKINPQKRNFYFIFLPSVFFSL
jgi:hypothetical protein